MVGPRPQSLLHRAALTGLAVSLVLLIGSDAAGARVVISDVTINATRLHEHERVTVVSTFVNRSARTTRYAFAAWLEGPRGADIPDTGKWDAGYSSPHRLLAALWIHAPRDHPAEGITVIPRLRPHQSVRLRRTWWTQDDYYSTSRHPHPRYHAELCPSNLDPASPSRRGCATSHRTVELVPPKLPDYQIRNLRIQAFTAPYSAGDDRVRVTGTVVNLGTDRTAETTSDDVDTVDFDGPYPSRSGSFLFRPLRPGRATDFSFDAFASSDGTGTRSHFKACADTDTDAFDSHPPDLEYAGLVRESHEANNCMTAYGPVDTGPRNPG